MNEVNKLSRILATQQCGKVLFYHWGSGKYLSTFANFNRCEHTKEIYYFAASGYMVKFYKQAILNSSITCYNDNTKEYTICFYVTIRNINCRVRTCRNTCADVDGNVLVYHQNNTVIRYKCKTDHPILFQDDFYIPLISLIKNNADAGADRIQKFMCDEKRIWINNELINRLYCVFNNGQIFVERD